MVQMEFNFPAYNMDVWLPWAVTNAVPWIASMLYATTHDNETDTGCGVELKPASKLRLQVTLIHL